MPRFLAALFCVLFLSSCSVVEPIENRDYAFVTWRSLSDEGSLVVRKIGVIRDRPDAPVRFEGVYDETLLNDAFFFGASPVDLGVRDDGVQMFVSLGQGVGSATEANFRIFDVENARERLRIGEDDAARDAVLTCDLSGLFGDRVEQAMRTLGLDPGVPFELAFIPMSHRDLHLREFEPLGWTVDLGFGVRTKTRFTARVSRDGARLASIIVGERDLFLTYDVDSSIPTCSTEAPGIRAEKRPYVDSTILREPERAQRVVIGGSLLYGFPTVAGTTPVPLFIPGERAVFYGPFRR